MRNQPKQIKVIICAVIVYFLLAISCTKQPSTEVSGNHMSGKTAHTSGNQNLELAMGVNTPEAQDMLNIEPQNDSEDTTGESPTIESKDKETNYSVEDDPRFFFTCNGRDFTLGENISNVETIFPDSPAVELNEKGNTIFSWPGLQIRPYSKTGEILEIIVTDNCSIKTGVGIGDSIETVLSKMWDGYWLRNNDILSYSVYLSEENYYLGMDIYFSDGKVQKMILRYSE